MIFGGVFFIAAIGGAKSLTLEYDTCLIMLDCKKDKLKAELASSNNFKEYQLKLSKGGVSWRDFFELKSKTPFSTFFRGDVVDMGFSRENRSGNLLQKFIISKNTIESGTFSHSHSMDSKELAFHNGDEITPRNPVSEPETMILFGAGLIILVGIQRHRSLKK